MQNLNLILAGLESGRITAAELVDQALSHAADPALQGNVSFRRLFPDQARHEASYWDEKRATGQKCPSLAGVPFSVKDNFDVQGRVTCAASPVLKNNPRASRDAPFLAKLRALGAVLIGQTNMTEFAYSGLGLNSHFGTPLSPAGRAQSMVAGGSSSGGAVSVAEGMSLFAVGSDTSGSCRIPAACCGLAGFRPSQSVFPSRGIIPLAPSFDVPGLIAPDVSGLAALFDAVTGHEGVQSKHSLCGKRFLLPTDLLLEETDSEVRNYYDQAISVLTDLGVKTDRRPFLFDQIANELPPSDIVTYEAFQFHKDYLAKQRAEYDPRIAMRMEQAAKISSARYSQLLEKMRGLRRLSDKILADFDGLLLPTLPILPPRLNQLTEEKNYLRMNSLIIRNTAIANHLDLPSVSIPMVEATAAGTPVSLQLIGARNADHGALHLASLISKHL
ncbi:amidase [Roseobacter sp. SK209-2-6]|uniref:amidase n=1 Tax=Roseobacter sp. SK209-2-6 TaxID=388739 RepID=UPI0000F3EF49|nr:amidase family protein [Roseobacter sp. SK209-2-6]EBA16796.1 amidase [Roseobacter sp. SK209-2-6]